LILVADTTGQHTGDPPGVVMVAGSDPADEERFTPHELPGVYTIVTGNPVAGVVEMDGAQHRYRRAEDTPAHVTDGRPVLEVVRDTPASWHYEASTRTLYLHTSDGQPPRAHELELIHRGNGIALPGRDHVTVMGFTFRHMGDAGINFWRESHDGLAIDNVAWGCRQGIRVYGATNIALYGNTLFRNDNSGAYFAAESVNGVAIGNRAYENVKGLRWSSGSANAVVVDNRVFDNREAGISIERADRALLRRNVLSGNARYQLLVIEADYSSEENCFVTVEPHQLVADFLFVDHYRTLAEYQRGRRQDLHSRAGGCPKLPEKLDVRRLHAETMGYADRARRILSARPAP
jgi:parallel beta-helix repeat protein